MIRMPLITLGFLFCAAAATAAPKEPDVSFLSAGAQTVLTQVKGLHEQIHSKIEATEDENARTVWKDLGRSLHEACMIGHGPGGRGHGPGHGPDHKPGEHRGPHALTDEQKQDFEKKLTSEACSQAISNTKGKLQ